MTPIAKTALALAAAAAAFAAVPAAANTITIAGGASLTCNAGAANQCVAISGGSLTLSGNAVTGGTAGSFGSNADTYNIGNSNPTNEAAALNVLAGTSFSTGTQSGDNPPTTFTFSSQYIALKLGNTHVFLQNLTGGAIEIVYSGAEALGLSHFTTFGDPIPVPAALWLMGAGLAGLGFAAKRKKS